MLLPIRNGATTDTRKGLGCFLSRTGYQGCELFKGSFGAAALNRVIDGPSQFFYTDDTSKVRSGTAPLAFGPAPSEVF